jgi:hypothetical protein
LRRQEDIKPGFDAFKERVETKHKNILTKVAIGRALHYAEYSGQTLPRNTHYAVNQLPLIEPFFEDGRIHLDNNDIDNKSQTWLWGGRTSYLQVPTREQR